MKAKTAAKKPNIFVRMGRKLKEVFSELKKVTWPSFGTVVKQTGIVLSVVLVFLLVLMGFDALLGWLYDLLVTGLNAGTETATTAALTAAKSFMGGVGLPLCL